MEKLMSSFTFKNILIVISIVFVDLIIYLFLGLLLMVYDDFYDESKGEYWSFNSMTNNQKIVSIAFELWNVINLILLIYLIYKLVLMFKNR